MPPTFTRMERGCGFVDGAELWLFALPDGDPAGTGLPVMLSTEVEPGLLLMGRVDPLDRRTFSNVEWSMIAAQFSGSVRDHWHLCIRDEHWVSYAYTVTGTDHYLQLLKVAAADVVNEVDVVPLDEVAVVTPSPLGGMVEDYTTNDHFMMRRKGGVVVGVWDLNDTVKLVVIDSSLNYRAEAEIGDSADPIANGSSAVRVWPDEAHVMASTNLDFSVAGTIKYLKYRLTDTERWTDGTRFLTIERTNYNCSMATVVVLANDWTVITFKRNRVRLGAGPAVPDGGSIIRHVYNPRGVFHSRETLLRPNASGRYGNRPHTISYEAAGIHYLITTWDETSEADPAVKAYMRVDRIDW